MDTYSHMAKLCLQSTKFIFVKSKFWQIHKIYSPWNICAVRYLEIKTMAGKVIIFSLQSSFIMDAKPPSMRVLYQLRLEQIACVMILYSVCDAYLLEVCFVNSIKRMRYNEVSYFMLAYSNSWLPVAIRKTIFLLLLYSRAVTKSPDYHIEIIIPLYLILIQALTHW